MDEFKDINRVLEKIDRVPLYRRLWRKLKYRLAGAREATEAEYQLASELDSVRSILREREDELARKLSRITELEAQVKVMDSERSVMSLVIERDVQRRKFELASLSRQTAEETVAKKNMTG